MWHTDLSVMKWLRILQVIVGRVSYSKRALHAVDKIPIIQSSSTCLIGMMPVIMKDCGMLQYSKNIFSTFSTENLRVTS